jgi:hypothetical protein
MDENVPPHSLGLGGDGDEIDAIREVERRFGVVLDYADASSWKTAGDVFAALKRALPPEHSPDDDTWRRFAEAISAETGVDPTKVTADTLLLGTRRFSWRLLFCAILVCAVALAVSFWRA